MKITIIATSLSEESKSQIMAEKFQELLTNKGHESELLDLRQFTLPTAGQTDAWENPDVVNIAKKVEASSHIVFAVPIYCYDVNAAAKNMMELVGRAFTNKIISFICTAGGSNSYMAVMSFANHLMLDFRSVIVPRFLFVQSNHWSEDGQLDDEISKRMDQLHTDMCSISITQ